MMFRRFLLLMLVCACAAPAVAAGPKPIVIDTTYEHNKWGVQPLDIKRDFRAYTVSFDGNDDDNGDGSSDLWRIPEWVAYEIKSFDGDVPNYKRPSWFTDKELHKEGVAPCDDSYRGEGRTWNRGHMCMKHHAARLGRNADHNTHTLLNSVPQAARLNQGIWLDLEKKTAEWADEFGSVWVICGPIFNDRTPTNWIGGKNELKVAVPDHCFKIIVRVSKEDKDRPHILAFIYPNTNAKEALPRKGPFHHSDYQTTVNEIEARTGLDLLTELNDDVEEELESEKKPLIWP